MFGLCATALVTDVIQLATGYHTPFFLTVCKPNYTLPGVACDKNPYITQDICSGRDQYAILSARWIHTNNTMPSHICQGKYILLLCLGCYLICMLYLHIRVNLKHKVFLYVYAIHTHTDCPCSVAYPMYGLNRMTNRYSLCLFQVFKFLSHCSISLQGLQMDLIPFPPQILVRRHIEGGGYGTDMKLCFAHWSVVLSCCISSMAHLHFFLTC